MMRCDELADLNHHPVMELGCSVSLRLGGQKIELVG